MDEQNQTSQPGQAGVGQSPQADVSQDAKNMGMLCHLLGFLTSFLGPLILWLIKKDTMPFVDYHGKEALNFQITIMIASAVAGLSVICFIGVVLLPAVGLADLILSISPVLRRRKGSITSIRYVCV